MYVICSVQYTLFVYKTLVARLASHVFLIRRFLAIGILAELCFLHSN